MRALRCMRSAQGLVHKAGIEASVTSTAQLLTHGDILHGRSMASTSKCDFEDMGMRREWSGSFFPLPSIIGRELLVPNCAKAVLENQKFGKQLEESLWSPQFLQRTQLPSIENLSDIQIMVAKAPQRDPSQFEIEIENEAELNSTAILDEPDLGEGLLMHTKRTYQPSVIVRKRRHGFLARLRTVGGRRVIKRRMTKGRRKITA